MKNIEEKNKERKSKEKCNLILKKYCLKFMDYVMDRTQYGKIDPCARQPYRCALREKGFAPGCKLMFYLILVWVVQLLARVKHP